MARVALGPLIILLVLVNLAIVGNRVKTYPVQWDTRCAFELARRATPVPDFLVLGNSRAGRSIDPVYVAEKIAEKTGQKPVIERLSITWPDLPAYQLLAREYVRNHGFPREVLLQLSYNRQAKKQASVGAPIHGARSVMMGGIDDLIEIQAEADSTLDAIYFENQLRRGTRPTLALWLEKFNADVFAALRYPSWVLKNLQPETMCVGERADRQGPLWLYGDLPNPPPGIDPFDKGSPENWARKASNYLPIAPSADFRRFETEQTRSLIEFFKSGGSKVSLVLLPTYTEGVEEETRRQIATEFPGVPVFDLVSTFNQATAADPAKFFVDTDHVNTAGAIIISAQLAQQLAGG